MTSAMTIEAPALDNPDPKTLAEEVLMSLKYRVGKDTTVATQYDWLTATIKVVRDRVVDHWMQATKEAYDQQEKRVYYLSLEFLIGRLMRDAFSNLGLMENMREALSSLGVDLDLIAALEPDAALGNGGLGRLAACFMESMATVDIPAHGYGIRYANGMFRQEIHDGWQVELPETWLDHGNPWEFERRERSFEVGFGGSVESITSKDGRLERHVWKPREHVLAVAYDTPVAGWRAKRVNTLRLWSGMPIDPIRLDKFNAGDHIGALAESNKADALSRVLYPADSHMAGQELRLRQEYFFSTASLQDILQRHLSQYGDLKSLPDKAAIHLNDTHPAIAVPELMRLLMDVHGMDFDLAWDVTKRTFGYTNHTLLPEALESWPVPLFERLLPRHMQIVYAINAQVLLEARATDQFSDEQISRISLIQENGDRRVRMGNLAFVGSHSINGVSALHTELMKETVFADLHKLYPDRINNKTNGITPRRWLIQCNPGLTALAREAIGDRFMDDIEAIKGLDPLADDTAFREKFAAVKRQNKVRLANLVADRLGIKLDPSALFDIQVKRIHEYKRQLLNILEAIALYDQIRSHPERDWMPRVKFFGGKAAPSYHNAKLIIKLANDVARVINSDPSVRGLLKVVFVPNYNVSLAEVLMPAADLSEQISTAGMEASGTGNMKFALNGALTIGTLDGANVEIKEHVGDDNIFIFGLTTEEVAERRNNGYNPRGVIEASPELAQAVAAVSSGVFSPDDPNRYRDLINGLYDSDWFMVAADFDAYAACQREVDAVWRNSPDWYARAIRNVARVGWFSSDRTIRQYAKEIWNVPV
ncbi:glycogen/starch/alpha-glucan phosphorylase [Mesorhizobium sp. ESP6-5]|uniref:Alpha-1,4 glucan phosphorylase n=1 Tax=Mesorhizobium australicum (strain HAMBI 3006 / LMG 24608 / WSM2073) TaxID=754035 RepID=L0KPI6_MESAW|nr:MULTISPECIES: glycogen/starch/alpha-glucan phosphorylase [Mesorhizobium]AGB47317.1 glycogen/starch/alpha-glucan phosphorylase [Mesorhizobium australicum WSM2073]MBZ9694819.1 glycogen/starch/alpha-glucan phosphorylase [Mesorhizobium sp. CO1-1-9]MBZ9727424.1 glycogen/starch/alpha-glucan phosphorylase [Mesorhizobium sp. CO1-1-11]MBZ9755767.1 glycogen/starch/alpha-glucan phosphorylase [Mesorhizobium sp. ESP6-5]MBZ9977907.1 glycogen/starch/alpha-glucan phosphorylase [Mesorhizobium sp. BR-1-1-10]